MHPIEAGEGDDAGRGVEAVFAKSRDRMVLVSLRWVEFIKRSETKSVCYYT